jgi:hypothetical protein
MTEEQLLPESFRAIKARGFAVWQKDDLGSAFMALFDGSQIPVVGLRHVRQWGIQVDDEREILGHERTSVSDEDLWEIVLRAKDGSTYEVNSALLAPAPEPE